MGTGIDHDDIAQQIADNDRWTVFAYWVETLERFSWQAEASTARQAEDLAHAEARTRGGHLGVCAVIAGWHDAADSTYARWVDPDVNTQEDIDRQRAQLGWEPGVVGAPKTGAVDAAGGKSIPLRDARLYAALAMLLGILLIAVPTLIF